MLLEIICYYEHPPYRDCMLITCRDECRNDNERKAWDYLETHDNVDQVNGFRIEIRKTTRPILIAQKDDPPEGV